MDFFLNPRMNNYQMLGQFFKLIAVRSEMKLLIYFHTSMVEV